MFPYIKIFNKVITSYAIMAVIGVLVVGYLCAKEAKKHKIDDNDMIIFMLICSIGVLVGGHLLYGIVNFNLFINFITNLNKINSFNDFFDPLIQIFGGAVFYGGLIGGLIAGLIYGKIKKLDIKLYSYIITPFIPLFHFFGRIGCFLSGCCYGIESKFGFLYTHSLVEPANGVVRFPVQLLEALCNFILFLVLYRLQKKKKCYDYLLPLYLIIYSVLRFLLEFLRGDYYRGFLFGLSTSQIISILIFIITTIYIVVKKVNAKNQKR